MMRSGWLLPAVDHPDLPAAWADLCNSGKAMGRLDDFRRDRTVAAVFLPPVPMTVPEANVALDAPEYLFRAEYDQVEQRWYMMGRGPDEAGWLPVGGPTHTLEALLFKRKETTI